MFTRAVSRLSRKRPPSEINDSDSKPSSSHQSLNGTTRWATSLELLLEDPEGVKRFREFLKKEFSEENVLFWLACEEFKKIKDEKKMQAKANEIYMTFLSSKASFQVNVEGQSRLDESILEKPHPLMFQRLQDQEKLCCAVLQFHSHTSFCKQINHGGKSKAQNPNLSIFTQRGCQMALITFKATEKYRRVLRIFSLMKYDSYSRFLKSEVFLKLKQTEEQEENLPDAQTVAKRASRIYNT